MEPLNRDRRDLLRLAGFAGVSWLTPVGHWLARAAGKAPEPAALAILPRAAGGPSPLETFDAHPGKAIAAGTGSIRTSVKEIIVAPGLDRTAEEMNSIALV